MKSLPLIKQHDFRLSASTFESVRLIVTISAMGIKIFLMPLYLQAYLNMARDRIEEQKKEAGRITNIDFQKKVVLCNGKQLQYLPRLHCRLQQFFIISVLLVYNTWHLS